MSSFSLAQPKMQWLTRCLVNPIIQNASSPSLTTYHTDHNEKKSQITME